MLHLVTNSNFTPPPKKKHLTVSLRFCLVIRVLFMPELNVKINRTIDLTVITIPFVIKNDLFIYIFLHRYLIDLF